MTASNFGSDSAAPYSEIMRAPGSHANSARASPFSKVSEPVAVSSLHSPTACRPRCATICLPYRDGRSVGILPVLSTSCSCRGGSIADVAIVWANTDEGIRGFIVPILGADGISLEFPIIRHRVNLESVLTYEGTPEMHQLVLGQAFTGEKAFR
jgi:hypothetical protein